jgi:hypothetical protein
VFAKAKLKLNDFGGLSGQLPGDYKASSTGNYNGDFSVNTPQVLGNL